jgi:sRNA-binding protein
LLPREEYKKLFEELCAKYPNLFDINNKRVRILASGIHLQVREELGWSAKTTRNFFAIFCHAKKYKKMCVKGAKRYDLQGKVIGEVE